MTLQIHVNKALLRMRSCKETNVTLNHRIIINLKKAFYKPCFQNVFVHFPYINEFFKNNASVNILKFFGTNSITIIGYL